MPQIPSKNNIMDTKIYFTKSILGSFIGVFFPDGTKLLKVFCVVRVRLALHDTLGVPISLHLMQSTLTNNKLQRAELPWYVTVTGICVNKLLLRDGSKMPTTVVNLRCA